MKHEVQKKKALTALLVFLAICLAFVIFECYCMAHFQDQEVFYGAAYRLYLFSPAIACIVARLLTGEGFRDGILLFRLSGNGKAYVLAVLLPLIAGILAGILSGLFLGGGLTVKLPGGGKLAFLSILLLCAEFYYIALVVFGEELGWRALLYDKLELLMGTSPALILGGSLWGLWHFPVLYYLGINFGKDYPGFPYVGILLMCIACIFMGAGMWLVRKLSGSVIPACIFHGIIDSVYGGLGTLFLSEETVAGHTFALGIYTLLIPSILMGIPCWIRLLHLREGEKTGIN